MKFKPKYALAALALAIAGQAGAQTLTALPATGNPSLFFVSVDEAAGRSYFSEMVSNAGSTTVGVLNMDDLISNPAGNWTITLSGLNAYVGGSSSPLVDIVGGFGATENNATVGGGSSVATGSRRTISSVAEGNAAPTWTNSQVNSSSGALTQFHDSFQGSGLPGLCNTSPCVATSGSALNYAGITNPTNLGIGTQWSFPSGFSMGDSFAGTIAWDIYLLSSSSTLLSGQANVVLMTAMRAVLDLATNTLTIGAAVPVPAAIWLLGSAMLGLVGIGRRKKGALPNGALAAA